MWRGAAGRCVRVRACVQVPGVKYTHVPRFQLDYTDAVLWQRVEASIKGIRKQL